jgi:hypothetical protein
MAGATERETDRSSAPRTTIRTFEHKEPEMADVLYVVLTVVTFAVLALIVKGVERLER